MSLKVKEKQVAREEEAYKAAQWGALRGGSIGLLVGLTGGAILQYISPVFQRITIPGKVFLISSAAVAGVWIGADKGVLNYARNPPPLPVKAEEEIQLEAPSSTLFGVEKKTLSTYRFHIIGGIWVTSVLGSLAWTLRQKHVRFSQRLIQARVFAQFITIGTLLGTAVLTQVPQVEDEEDADDYTRRRKY